MSELVARIDRPIGSLVRDVREQAGLSQSELAARVGTTQSAISRWERGHDEPRLSTLANIARACGRTASIVIGDGVDRAQIRDHLAMAPTDRLRAVANVSRLRAVARPAASK